MISKTKLIVRYQETDQMGIVHHSNYPVWFEAARTDFIKKVGISYSEIESKGLLLPVIELNCCYKGSARYEDNIVVKTHIDSMTGVRIVFSYEVFIEGNEKPITTGQTTHVWTTKDLKPVNLKKHMPELYELLSQCL